MRSIGSHLLADFYDCECGMLDNKNWLEKVLTESVKRANAKALTSNFHEFNPFGISGVIIIAESHFAVHTWPEHKFVSLDIYTCGGNTSPWSAFEYLKKMFKPKNVSVVEMKRGVLDVERKVVKKCG